MTVSYVPRPRDPLAPRRPDTPIDLPTARQRLVAGLVSRRDALARAEAMRSSHGLRVDRRQRATRLQAEALISRLAPETYDALAPLWDSNDLAALHTPGTEPHWCTVCAGEIDSPQQVEIEVIA